MFVFLLLFSTNHEVASFTVNRPSLITRTSATQLRNEKGGGSSNFFQDMLQSAFANDDQLLSQSNKRVGMLDEALDGDGDTILVQQPTPRRELTATQQAWRQSMSSGSAVKVENADLIGTRISVDLYLTGVPNKDPSNDLYASRTNISARDRSVGQVLPAQPTLSGIQIQFAENQKCVVSTTAEQISDKADDAKTTKTQLVNAFVNTQIEGDWKLSDDGRQLRCRMQVYGFQRTVQTKGSIQKIYWSQEKESISETSTIYSIPEGWLYFEMDLSRRRNSNNIQWSPNGVLKIEQPMGMFGVASRMSPCGKFVVSSSNTNPQFK
jgi:hypothetical protein